MGSKVAYQAYFGQESTAYVEDKPIIGNVYKGTDKHTDALLLLVCNEDGCFTEIWRGSVEL